MKRTLCCCLFMLVLSGCASTVGSGASKEGLLAQIENVVTGAPQTTPAVIELNGTPALLYASKDNRITFQYGDKRQLLDSTAPVTGGNRYQLHMVDQKLLALWWSHQDGKNLYASVSDDFGKTFSPTSIVNIEHGVLPPYYVLRGPQATLGVVYLDERELGYQAYSNRSLDYGKTWARPDQRLDTPPPSPQASRVQEPQGVEAGSVWFVAWADVERTADGIGYRILGRRSEDAGLHWSEPEVVYRPQKFISSLTVRAEGRTIVIAADELSRGVFTITSNDQGQTWRNSGFAEGSGFAPGTEGSSNSGIDFALAGGRAYLVWSQDRAAEKTKVMRATLDTENAKWLTPTHRVDTKKHDNTRSIAPKIAISASGTIWAAWVDYRDIRPNVYLSYSVDHGTTWSTPMAIEKPGVKSAGFPMFQRWGQDIALGYEVYPTDVQTDGKFLLKSLTLSRDGAVSPALSGPSPISEEERKAKLEQRIKSLWNARLEGDYNSAYDFFDFAYKAATPKKNYVENVGVITYLAYSIDDISVAGPEATVKMKIKYEVRPTMLPSGKPLKLESVEVESTNTWVQVGEDWFLMYSPAFGQPNLKY